jgi:hypothetical protein
MLKISQNPPRQGRALLVLEGRLVGPWVAELRGATAGAAGGPHELELDLAGVTFADEDGVAALRALGQSGARLTGASGFLTALLR